MKWFTFKNNKCRLIGILMLWNWLTAVYAPATAQQAMPKRLPGQPSEIEVTPYKTTMLANGRDTARIVINIIDVNGKKVPGARASLHLHIIGDARITNIKGIKNFRGLQHTDSTWTVPVAGSCSVILQAGRTRGSVKFVANANRADSLYPGSTEIHTVQEGKPHPVTSEVYQPRHVNGKILGADISFLPELESRNAKFSDKGVERDAIEIFKDHGFNYIRIRIFNNPAQPKGYSPGKGFCDLAHTKEMAKRIKAAGLKFLLDFHYSDYWADPQQQYKPAAWAGENFTALKKSVYDYTVDVMKQLEAQGTTPDMVQVGNEINHGMIWPEGAINNLDSLAQLIYSGVRGVHAVSPQTAVMLHIALGGQNAEARFFLDNMLERHVPFDVIGLSYYPKWHGTPADLKANMADLAKRYHRQVMVAEYTQLKQQVNDIAFHVPYGEALGTFIWEPINTWESVFDHQAQGTDYHTNSYIDLYPQIAKKYDISTVK